LEHIRDQLAIEFYPLWKVTKQLFPLSRDYQV
jgi:hypothetical protein